MKRGRTTKPDRLKPLNGKNYVRVNISITPGQIEELLPLLRKHENNLSAAVREAIDIASIVLEGKVKISRPGLQTLIDEFYTKLVLYTEHQK